MKYILDSSVAVKWELREKHSDKADALLEMKGPSDGKNQGPRE
jgi:hypothetical protein